MKKKIILIITAVVPLLLQAQVTLSVQLPPAGMIRKDQLWNLVLVNNSNEMQDVLLSLNLQDATTGQVVFSAGTRNFLVGKGVKVISYKDVLPVQYNYMAADLTGNFIPLGSYIACYRAYKREKANSPLADECVRINIDPLSPPLLNTPADKTQLETKYPQFTWIPPAPAELFSDLNYTISIVEINDGQSPSEAILNNIPVFANADIRVPFQTYPSSFNALVPGKNYAWQVTAKNGFNYSAQTEVWTFSLRSADTTKLLSSTDAYIQLRDKAANAGVNFINNRNLFVKYYSFDQEHEAIVKILTTDGTLIQELKQKIIYGDNFLLFELNKHFKEGEIYTLEINDTQKNKYRVQFSIRKTNSIN